MTAATVVLVFLSALALDFAAAHYTRALVARRTHAAGMWSVCMCLLSTVGLVALVEISVWFVVVECAGLYAGTLLSGVLGLERANAADESTADDR